MNQQLFPKEIIDNTQEANFSKHSLRSKVIYTSTIMFLIWVLCMLPFIKVDVGVRSQGLIRPVTELVQLTSPVSGIIQTFNSHENKFIKKGEIFAIIEAPQITEKIRFIKSRQRQLNTFLNDLIILQNAATLEFVSSIKLDSPRYKQTYLEYSRQLLNQQHEINQLKRILKRDTVLFENEAISFAGLEESRFTYQTAIRQFNLLVDQQKNRWKLDEIKFQNELDKLQSEHIQLQQELKRYKITAPITGTIQNIAGIFWNSYVHTNQILAEVSPDTNLIAEAIVSPRDIGLLQEGMPVRMQIDAYNYNQWGVVTGRIESISTDVTMNENKPLFRVLCSLNQTFLRLQNGFRGDIKKGMTFQARFIVNKRSLFQLLYDNVDDWLNPALGENEYTVQAVNQ